MGEANTINPSRVNKYILYIISFNSQSTEKDRCYYIYYTDEEIESLRI